MRAAAVETVSVFAVLVGVCTLVGAAALVHPALAVAVAGAFLLLGGVLGVQWSRVLHQAETAQQRAGERRSS